MLSSLYTPVRSHLVFEFLSRGCLLLLSKLYGLGDDHCLYAIRGAAVAFQRRAARRALEDVNCAPVNVLVGLVLDDAF